MNPSLILVGVKTLVGVKILVGEVFEIASNLACFWKGLVNRLENPSRPENPSRRKTLVGVKH